MQEIFQENPRRRRGLNQPFLRDTRKWPAGISSVDVGKCADACDVEEKSRLRELAARLSTVCKKRKKNPSSISRELKRDYYLREG